MQFTSTVLLALAAAFPLGVTAQSCDSSIDTTVGASCSEVGTYACANTNTAVVSEALVLTKTRAGSGSAAYEY